MTTQAFVMDCIKEMLPKLEKYIIEKAEFYLSSGAIDLSAYQDDYIVSKLILHTIIVNDLSWQYKPLSKEGKSAAKNLGCF